MLGFRVTDIREIVVNLDFSVLMPLIAIAVSIGAALFWGGHDGKGIKAEEYLYTIVREKAVSLNKADAHKVSVRVEVQPGVRLRPSDLRARDKTESTIVA